MRSGAWGRDSSGPRTAPSTRQQSAGVLSPCRFSSSCSDSLCRRRRATGAIAPGGGLGTLKADLRLCERCRAVASRFLRRRRPGLPLVRSDPARGTRNSSRTGAFRLHTLVLAKGILGDHRDVCSWGYSGSRFWATECLLVAKSRQCAQREEYSNRRHYGVTARGWRRKAKRRLGRIGKGPPRGDGMALIVQALKVPIPSNASGVTA